ncbi:sugar transferase [Actinoplanes sp. NPDC049599]|uniref:sugar transferase n=1 Tax=Actinoplanes sp. NPDC049599 TaxID=3363903 RepID=UPI0037B9D06C
MRWRPSPATPVVVGAAFALVGNLATNTVEIEASWWPPAVWSLAAALVVTSAVIELGRSRDQAMSTSAGEAAEVSPARRVRFGLAVLVVAISVGIPVLAVIELPQLLDRPWVTALAVVLYEITLVTFGFVATVWRDLSHRWAARLADATDAWLRRRMSRFSNAYVRYVRAATRYLDLKGLSHAEYSLEMRDVLVRLALVPRLVHEVSADPVGASDRRGEDAGGEQVASIWIWLRRARHEQAVLSVIGPPGSGKTTLLRHVAYTMARGGRTARSVGAPRKLPILVSLREHSSKLFDHTFTMADLIRSSLSFVERPEPPGWVEHNLRRGNFLVLLDGLDEVPESSVRRSVSDWLERQVGSHPGNSFVVTSRPFGYRYNPVAGAMVVEVQRFTEPQIAAFVRQWYRAVSIRSYGGDNESARFAAKTGAAELIARLAETPALSELTVNPLLLTMVVNVHRHRGALPGGRAELYQEICDVFLGKRHQARGVVVEMPGRQRQAVLRALAFEMMVHKVTEVREHDAGEWIAEALARISTDLSTADFLKSAEDSSGLLIEKERGVYAFAHLTFQEYLAADHLREHGGVDVLLAGLDTSWWRETMRLYAAIADATPIVEACLDRRDDPALLALGLQCVEEAHEVSRPTRDRLDRYLNPPDARTNVDSRHLAARVRLLLRAFQDQALPASRYIARTGITWIEYQYFLDSTMQVRSRIPDHWHEGVFPRGSEDECATGIRFDDAVAFCDWMRVETASLLMYRPPHTDEIDSATIRENGNLLAYWTTLPPHSGRDVGFAQLLRDGGAGRRREPYRTGGAPPMARQALEQVLNADVAAAELWQDPQSAKMLGRLRGLAVDCWENTAGWDGGQLLVHANLSDALVRQYSETQRQFVYDHGAQSDLRDSSQRICAVLPDVLDRSRYAQRGSAEFVLMRRGARQSALRAAVSCMALFGDHGGGSQFPAPGWVPRPTFRTPNPSREPTVVLAALAHAFIGTYVDLVLLEARLAGELMPAESILYVRQPEEEFFSENDRLLQQAEAVPRTLWRKAKPAFDYLAGVALLVLSAPLMLVIASIVRLGSPGRALFRQSRVGLDGRPFTIYKFRTMYGDAEARLAALRHLNDYDGVLFKLRADPRVTPFGQFLRRYSLDELPQLFNVIRGDMSLVGPRPPLPREVVHYSDTMRRRLLVKPGMTGLWQVMGRSDLSWEQSINLDLAYVDSGTLAMDLSILLRTPTAMFRATGAY